MSQFFTSAEAGTLPGTVIETITGNDGVPESGIAHNFNILTANATPKFKGSAGTETLDFGLDVLLIGSNESISSTSQSCVGVGLGALSSITSATNSVAIGRSCMANTTSGIQNTAVGDLALNANLISSDSVAIGYNALNAATGGGNTAVGSGSLTALTTSGQCVAVGYEALGAVRTSGNTGIGFRALSSVTTGSGVNTALGGSAGLNLATGSFNILIGQNSGVNYANAESSNIIIGNVGFANESNVIKIGASGSSSQQQNKCFIAGITGVTTAGSPCAVSSTGQLSDLGFGTAGQTLTSNGVSVSPTFQGGFTVLPGVTVDCTMTGLTKLFTTQGQFNVVGVSFLGVTVTGSAEAFVANLGWTGPDYSDLAVFETSGVAVAGSVLYFFSPAYSPSVPLPVVPASTDFYINITTADTTATADLEKITVFGYYI